MTGYQPPRPDELLARAVNDTDARVRATAVRAIASRRSEVGARQVAQLALKEDKLERDPAELRLMLVTAASIIPSAMLGPLEKLMAKASGLTSGHKATTLEAVTFALSVIDSPEARELLNKGARTLNPKLRGACKAALEQGGRTELARVGALGHEVPRRLVPWPAEGALPFTPLPPASKSADLGAPASTSRSSSGTPTPPRGTAVRSVSQAHGEPAGLRDSHPAAGLASPRAPQPRTGDLGRSSSSSDLAPPPPPPAAQLRTGDLEVLEPETPEPTPLPLDAIQTDTIEVLEPVDPTEEIKVLEPDAEPAIEVLDPEEAPPGTATLPDLPRDPEVGLLYAEAPPTIDVSRPSPRSLPRGRFDVLGSGGGQLPSFNPPPLLPMEALVPIPTPPLGDDFPVLEPEAHDTQPVNGTPFPVLEMEEAIEHAEAWLPPPDSGTPIPPVAIDPRQLVEDIQLDLPPPTPDLGRRKS